MQVQAVIDAGIIDKLIKIILHGDFDLSQEALWGLCNATQNKDPN